MLIHTPRPLVYLEAKQARWSLSYSFPPLSRSLSPNYLPVSFRESPLMHHDTFSSISLSLRLHFMRDPLSLTHTRFYPLLDIMAPIKLPYCLTLIWQEWLFHETVRALIDMKCEEQKRKKEKEKERKKRRGKYLLQQQPVKVTLIC